jgi:hypothetical protein
MFKNRIPINAPFGKVISYFLLYIMQLSQKPCHASDGLPKGLSIGNPFLIIHRMARQKICG